MSHWDEHVVFKWGITCATCACYHHYLRTRPFWYWLQLKLSCHRMQHSGECICSVQMEHSGLLHRLWCLAAVVVNWPPTIDEDWPPTAASLDPISFILSNSNTVVCSISMCAFEYMLLILLVLPRLTLIFNMDNFHSREKFPILTWWPANTDTYAWTEREFDQLK